MRQRMARFHDPVLCFSHLRWGFVFQRPQHLLTRCARDRPVYYVEEPIFDSTWPRLEMQVADAGVVVVVPHLPADRSAAEIQISLRHLIDSLVLTEGLRRAVLWYTTPIPLAYTRHLESTAIVFDCMDELSAFKDAPRELIEREQEIFAAADLAFTGGHSLFEAKRHRHRNIHAFPSSVDVPHFAAARTITEDPADQAAIPHPRVGFFGVIDERMDLDLVAGLAVLRPDLHLVMLGPVVKIDPASLPSGPNLHWLGCKTYGELPAYLAGWDVAILPFARNESTRFISPTKTPEYLAAGRPVVSTSIRDVIRPYGEQGMAWIADTPEAFSAAIDNALAEDAAMRLGRADAYLADLSWDRTFAGMWGLVEQAIEARSPSSRTATGSMAHSSLAARREQVD